MRRDRGVMARRCRDKAAGLFHVYTHSVWAAELFRDDRDRGAFLRELVIAGAKVQDALPIGMHSLNFRHAVEFNRRHGMKGHVLGARYDSVASTPHAKSQRRASEHLLQRPDTATTGPGPGFA
jgi:hypothetical protein